MSESDRSRHVALIGASLAAISVICGTLTYSYHMGELSGRKDAQAEGYAAAYPNDTSKQIADCWTKADTATAQECVAGAIQASHEAQRSEADLSAQRQMSDWAFWALIVGILMAFITTIGTYLIFRQVELTRKAVEDTGNATDAMLDANEIARAAQRPWVAIDCHLVKFERKSHFMTAELIVEFKNIGKNIAYDCYHCAHVNIVNPYNREPINQIMNRFDKARSDKFKPNDPFIPGDTSEIRIRSNFAFFRNDSVTDQLSPVSATVTAAAYYKSSPAGKWHETELSFLIFGPDEFDMVIHPTISEGALGGKAIHLRRYVSGAIS